jgi:methylated-DNA-[protein]-cysteine S-methyltransferase
MRCSDVEALWDDLRGGLEPRSEHAVAHLRRCTDCQAVYEQYEGVAYCLTCLPLVEPPENLVPRILDHIKALRNHYRSSRSDSIARVASPLGELWIAWRDVRITFVGLDRGQDPEAAIAQIERRLSRPVRTAQAPDWIIGAVDDFFATGRVDISRIDISELSAFEQAALRKAAQIPAGEVRSYGWIAREIGHPHAARAVGQVMARNPVALLFPCHRVVDASGALHNYGYGIEIKAKLLRMEGYVKAGASKEPGRVL